MWWKEKAFFCAICIHLILQVMCLSFGGDRGRQGQGQARLGKAMYMCPVCQGKRKRRKMSGIFGKEEAGLGGVW